MATVANKFMNTGNKTEYQWDGIVTGDTVTEDKLSLSGQYRLHVYGTFNGGTTAKFLVGSSTGPTKSISTDATGTEWSVTAAGASFVVDLAAGDYVKPSVASGSADAVTFNLRYIGEV